MKKKKISKLAKIFDYRVFGNDFTKITGAIPTMIYFRLKKLFVNKKALKSLRHKPYLIAANHTNLLDVIVVALTFPFRRIRFVATSDLFRNKFLNFLFKFFGCIKVDKNNVSMNTFKGVKEGLNYGHCVCVFPEGTIAGGEEFTDYKSGIILMSSVSKVPIVPIYIPVRKKWYNRQIVVMGDIFDINDYIKSPIPTMEEIQLATQKLKEIEFDLKEKYEKELL